MFLVHSGIGKMASASKGRKTDLIRPSFHVAVVVRAYFFLSGFGD
jgi:hypothetical protein